MFLPILSDGVRRVLRMPSAYGMFGASAAIGWIAARTDVLGLGVERDRSSFFDVATAETTAALVGAHVAARLVSNDRSSAFGESLRASRLGPSHAWLARISVSAAAAALTSIAAVLVTHISVSSSLIHSNMLKACIWFLGLPVAVGCSVVSGCVAAVSSASLGFAVGLASFAAARLPSTPETVRAVLPFVESTSGSALVAGVVAVSAFVCLGIAASSRDARP